MRFEERELLIVAKTRMYANVCVGSICMRTGESFRLLDISGNHQPTDSKFNIGEVWKVTLNVDKSDNVNPHTEDARLSKYHTSELIKEDVNVVEVARKFNLIKQYPNITSIFMGTINDKVKGTLYVEEQKGASLFISTEFVQLNEELNVKSMEDGKIYYEPDRGLFRAPQAKFVGFQNPVKKLEEGTVLRFSLTRLYTPDETKIKPSYWVQLSGWF